MAEFYENLPDIGEGVVEGEIVEWFVEIGSYVETGDPIVSVMTDKATVEVPYQSKKSAYVSHLHGKPGDIVAVNEPIISLSGVTKEEIKGDFEYVMDKIMEVDSRLVAKVGGTYRSFRSQDVFGKKIINYKNTVLENFKVRLSTNKFDRRLAILFVMQFFMCRNKNHAKLHGLVRDELSMEKKFQTSNVESLEIDRMLQENTDEVSSLDGTKIAAYIDLGLEENYAKAIVAGIDADEIMTLWESDWRKQYESDDFLIAAVLSGQISANDAEYLNGIRSDHDDLVQACLSEEVSIEWTRALMDAGFNSYPDAVSGILKGT